MTGVVVRGAKAPALRLRGMPDARGIAWLPGWLAIVVAVASYQLAQRIGALGLWPEGTARLAGRAALSAAGAADPTTLLAVYPPLPYLFILLGDHLGRPLGLDPVALVDALLLGGLAGRYAQSLRRRGLSHAIVIAFVALLCLNPLTIEAVARGPQAMLIVLGTWVLARSVVDTRTVTGVNDLIALTLALPMLAMTGPQGAIVAIAAIPFLLVAVPRDMIGWHYGSAYVVLLFPLVFGGACMVALSATLLHDPLAFLVWDVERAEAGEATAWWATIIVAPLATFAAAAAVVQLAAMPAAPRALRECAGALLGTLTLAAILSSASGVATEALDAMIPVVGAAAALTTRWPVERMGQAAGALLAGAIVVAAVALCARDLSDMPVARAVTGRPDALSADDAVGRYLAGRHDVMIDALAHPAVVAARGSASGLLTDQSPAFGVALLSHRAFARTLAVHDHRPGQSDDAITRSLPDVFQRGAPGYRLAFDRAGWRVWTRTDGTKP